MPEYRISVGRLRSVGIYVYTRPPTNGNDCFVTVTMFRGDENYTYRNVKTGSLKRVRRVQDVLIERFKNGYTI